MGSEQFNGWETVYNDKSKKYYYHHLKTGTTQWENPKNWIKHINDSDSSVYYEGPDGATTRTKPVKKIINFSRKLLTTEQFDQLVIPPGWKKYFSKRRVYFSKPGQKETTFDLEIWRAGDEPAAATATPSAATATPSVAADVPKPIDFSKKLLTEQQFDQLVVPPGWKKYFKKDQKGKLKVYFSKPGQKETTWILEPVAAAAPTIVSEAAAAAAVPIIVSGSKPAAVAPTIVSGSAAAAGSKPSAAVPIIVSGSAAAAGSKPAAVAPIIVSGSAAAGSKLSGAVPTAAAGSKPSGAAKPQSIFKQRPQFLPKPTIIPSFLNITGKADQLNALKKVNNVYEIDERIKEIHRILYGSEPKPTDPDILSLSRRSLNVDQYIFLTETQKAATRAWSTLHTVGDGTCFIHAVLQAISPTYRKIRLYERKSEVGKIFRKYVFVQEYDSSEEKRFIRSNEYLTHMDFFTFATNYKVNILVLASDETVSDEHGRPIQRGTITQFPSAFVEGNPVIFVFDDYPRHFETIRHRLGASLMISYIDFITEYRHSLMADAIKSTLIFEAQETFINELIRHLYAYSKYRHEAELPFRRAFDETFRQGEAYRNTPDLLVSRFIAIIDYELDKLDLDRVQQENIREMGRVLFNELQARLAAPGVDVAGPVARAGGAGAGGAGAGGAGYTKKGGRHRTRKQNRKLKNN